MTGVSRKRGRAKISAGSSLKRTTSCSSLAATRWLSFADLKPANMFASEKQLGPRKRALELHDALELGIRVPFFSDATQVKRGEALCLGPSDRRRQRLHHLRKGEVHG